VKPNSQIYMLLFVRLSKFKFNILSSFLIEAVGDVIKSLFNFSFCLLSLICKFVFQEVFKTLFTLSVPRLPIVKTYLIREHQTTHQGF